MSKRYYYYVGVKYAKPPLYIHHCDILREIIQRSDNELQKYYSHIYAFMFGAYNRKWKAIETAQYQGYVIDNQ